MRCGGKSARCETSYAVRSQRVCGGNEPLVHSSACGTYLNHTSNVSRSYSTVTDQHSTALAATFGSTLPLGSDSITAVYIGATNFGGSTSKPMKQVVTAGTHEGPYGVVSPTALNFGEVVVGQTSSPQLVSLINIVNSELTVSTISISGDFALPTNHCANGVKPSTHCNVYITFTPTGIGTATGTLTFTDNASNSPQTVSLTGTGTN